jgi:hypothetical protein
MYELRAALLEAADGETVARVGRKLAELAEGGDVQAAKVWLEYVVGRPPQALELSGPFGSPLGGDWSQFQRILLGALGNFPEARVALAVALRGLADDAHARDAERPGDGSRSKSVDGINRADS